MTDLHDKDIQILVATKGGMAGSKSLNKTIEGLYTAQQTPAFNWGLKVGSKVMWLKNNYQKAPELDSQRQLVLRSNGHPKYQGFMNGAIGHISHLCKDEERCWVVFDDGAEDWIYVKDMMDMDFGWCCSVHKAQGSAFQRVIIPITKSRLLDRALFYTALTRAVETCVFVGAFELARQVVQNPPSAYRRVVGIEKI